MENQIVEKEVNTEDLRQDILKDVKKEDSKESKKPWELRLEQDHPEMVEKPKEETIEEKPETEEQPAETDSQPVEKQPEEDAQPAEVKKDTAEDAYIAEYAKGNNLSVEDAKEEISKLKAITAKYGNDPVKLAKAYREMQSAYDKQKVTASSNINPAVAQIAANPRSYVIGEVKKNAEKLVAEFREQNPARSRDMDDEQVTEEIVERGTFAIKNQIRDYEIQLKKEAANKREEFVKGISESDRRFLPEIKPVLENLPDYQIISKTFNFDDLVSWAKGKSVDRIVKETEERVRKEYDNKDKKIVGSIQKSPQTTKVKQTQEQSKGAGLSKYQKDQATQMFNIPGMTDEEKFEAYIEVTKKKK